MTKTKLIQQRQSNDCGIAALAMLFDTPYNLMRNLVLQAETGKFDGTTADHARSVGLAFGDPVRLWLCSDESRADIVSRLKGRPAVLVVPAKDHKESGDWHAVYWTGKEVLDPSPTGKYGRKGIKALKTFRECWVIESDAE